MFDKLKQIKQLREVQKAAEDAVFEGENNGVRIVLNGTLMIQEVHLNEQLSREEQEQAIAQAVNNGMQKAQMEMAQKMQGMLGQ